MDHDAARFLPTRVSESIVEQAALRLVNKTTGERAPHELRRLDAARCALQRSRLYRPEVRDYLAI
jgi:hypothetical protein